MTGDQICRDLDRLKESGAALEAILERAVHELHESHPKFHWTGIYELFPDDILRLGTFIGAPTDHVFIGVGQGVCGTAVAEKRNINVPDVTKVSNYLACSTSTKSELVVLIRLGDTIFAQIDVDSHECNAFDAASVENVERVAAWLALEYARRRTAVAGPAASARR
jgi:L-methionine (R)-S-oxide reductase